MANSALNHEMMVLGFEKSEYASTTTRRVFFANLQPLKYKIVQNDEEVECEAPQSIVLEIQESKDHHNVYVVTTTLMLDSQPISDDLKPMTRRLELNDIKDWINTAKTLLILEAVRRNYGVEFNSGSDRKSEVQRVHRFGSPSHDRYAGRG